MLFLQGGATLQFAMVPMNLLGEGRKGGYVNSGSWGKGAITDAQPYGEIYTAWDGAQCNYTRMPKSGELEIQPGTRYLHITSNNTIFGTQYANWPDAGDVPLVVDASSDMLSRPLRWDRL